MITFEQAPVYKNWIAIESGQPVEQFASIPVATLIELYPDVHVVGPNPDGFYEARDLIAKIPAAYHTKNEEAIRLAMELLAFVGEQEDYAYQMASSDPIRYTAMVSNSPQFLSSAFTINEIQTIIMNPATKPLFSAIDMNSSNKFMFVKIIVNATATDIVPEYVIHETKARMVEVANLLESAKDK